MNKQIFENIKKSKKLIEKMTFSLGQLELDPIEKNNIKSNESNIYSNIILRTDVKNDNHNIINNKIDIFEPIIHNQTVINTYINNYITNYKKNHREEHINKINNNKLIIKNIINPINKDWTKIMNEIDNYIHKCTLENDVNIIYNYIDIIIHVSEVASYNYTKDDYKLYTNIVAKDIKQNISNKINNLTKYCADETIEQKKHIEKYEKTKLEYENKLKKYNIHKKILITQQLLEKEIENKAIVEEENKNMIEIHKIFEEPNNKKNIKHLNDYIFKQNNPSLNINFDITINDIEKEQESLKEITDKLYERIYNGYEIRSEQVMPKNSIIFPTNTRPNIRSKIGPNNETQYKITKYIKKTEKGKIDKYQYYHIDKINQSVPNELNTTFKKKQEKILEKNTIDELIKILKIFPPEISGDTKNKFDTEWDIKKTFTILLNELIKYRDNPIHDKINNMYETQALSEHPNIKQFFINYHNYFAIDIKNKSIIYDFEEKYKNSEKHLNDIIIKKKNLDEKKKNLFNLLHLINKNINGGNNKIYENTTNVLKSIDNMISNKFLNTLEQAKITKYSDDIKKYGIHLIDDKPNDKINENINLNIDEGYNTDKPSIIKHLKNDYENIIVLYNEIINPKNNSLPIIKILTNEYIKPYIHYLDELNNLNNLNLTNSYIISNDKINDILQQIHAKYNNMNSEEKKFNRIIYAKTERLCNGFIGNEINEIDINKSKLFYEFKLALSLL